MKTYTNRTFAYVTILAFCLITFSVQGQVTFHNGANFMIPAAGEGSSTGAVATPYPSFIVTSGLGATLNKVTVTLHNFTHTNPDDVDVLLVSPAGHKILLMSDIGGITNASDVTLIFDDTASFGLTDNQLISGTYKPSNSGSGDAFPSTAPAAPHTNDLSDCIGSNPNGFWWLYIVDDSNVIRENDTGTISGGWSLHLSATGTTRVWDGGGINNSMTNAQNWAGDVLPNSGDILVFPPNAPRVAPMNQFPTNTIFHSIVFGGTNYVMTGNPIILSSGITTTNTVGTNMFACSMTIGSPSFIVNGVNTALFVNNLIGTATSEVTKTGNGSLYLQGATNNVFGDMKINGGTVLPQKASSSLVAIPGPIYIGDGGSAAKLKLTNQQMINSNAPIYIARFSTLDLDGFWATVGPLHLVGSSVNTGAGRLTLNGDITAASSTFAGAASINGNVSLGGVTRTITVEAQTISSALNFNANIIDGGASAGIIKTGSETLNLAGSNSFTGPLTVNGGIVQLSHASATGSPTAGTTLNPETALILNGAHIASEPLTLNSTGAVFTATLTSIGASSWGGNINMTDTARIGVMNTNDSLTLSGAISGAGNLAINDDGIVTDGGSVTFTGTNSNSLAGIISVLRGKLFLAKTNATSIPQTLMIGNGNAVASCTLQSSNQISDTSQIGILRGSSFLLNNRSETIGSVLMTGGIIVSGTGTLTLNGPLEAWSSSLFGPSFITGNLSLGGATRTFNINENAISPGLIISATIVDGGSSAGITKTGGGVLQLSSANSYSGTTLVQSGAIDVRSSLALGSPLGSTEVDTNGQLILYSTSVQEEPLYLRGTLVAQQALNTNAWNGPMFVIGSPLLSIPTSNHVASLGGTITGLGGLNVAGPGTVLFNGTKTNTFGGHVYVTNGHIVLARSPGATSIPWAVYLGNGLQSATMEFKSSEQIADSGAIVVARGCLVNLNNHTETLNYVELLGCTVNTGTGLLRLTGDLQCSSSSILGPAIINGNLALGPGDHTFAIYENSTSPGLIINGVISDYPLDFGNIVKTGFGTLRLSGSAANTSFGMTTVNEGTLELAKSGSVPAINGTFIIGDYAGTDEVRLLGANQIFNTSNVHVNYGGVLNLNGFSETIGPLYGWGDVLLTNASLVTVVSDEATFSGVLKGNGGVTKNGPGKWTLTGNNEFTSPLTINGGVVNINGFHLNSQAIVNPGATLGGTGIVSTIVANGGSTVSPGLSPGKLTGLSGVTLNSGSTLKVELNGPTPGTQHDQLAGYQFSLDGCYLQLSHALGSTGAGTTYKIIDNTFEFFTTGIFEGLPEGAITNLNGIPFQISYTAGSDNNDVVLTQLPFSGGGATIPNLGPASTYPLTITLSNVVGVIGQISVTLSNVTHQYPDDLDILLVGPQGQSVILMSDAGGDPDINNVTLTFHPWALNSLPDTTVIGPGVYLPTNYEVGDNFDLPAPGGAHASDLYAFRGTDPNGTWSLYIVDDQGGDVGSISGWSIGIFPYPDLKIAHGNNKAVVSWPAAALGFNLESAPNLDSGWAPVVTPPTVIGNYNVVTNSATNVHRFFRLKK
jgi:autotransporter-associated beta strand protein